jgi:hypothetical protein
MYPFRRNHASPVKIVLSRIDILLRINPQNTDATSLRLAALAPAPHSLGAHETLNLLEPYVWIHVTHPFVVTNAAQISEVIVIFAAGRH